MKDIILKLEKLIKECSVALAGTQEAEISVGHKLAMSVAAPQTTGAAWALLLKVSLACDK